MIGWTILNLTFNAWFHVPKWQSHATRAPLCAWLYWRVLLCNRIWLVVSIHIPVGSFVVCMNLWLFNVVFGFTYCTVGMAVWWKVQSLSFLSRRWVPNPWSSKWTLLCSFLQSLFVCWALFIAMETLGLVCRHHSWETSMKQDKVQQLNSPVLSLDIWEDCTNSRKQRCSRKCCVS